MLNLYCNQDISVKIKAEGSENDYNEPEYTESTIKARFEYSLKLIRNKEGKDIISEAIIITETKLKPNDIVIYDGYEFPVLFTGNLTRLEGTTIGYEVRLGERQN